MELRGLMKMDDMLTVEGIHFQTGRPIKLFLKNGVIQNIKPITKERPLPNIAPGLVDIQINGYRGIDFNTLPLSDTEIREVTRELWKKGVTTYLPTIITNANDKIEEAMRCIAKACQTYPDVGKGISGIHLEGPFISSEDGPRGAHQKKYIQPPDWELFQRWQDAAEGNIKIITLSPEWPNSNTFITKCVENDVIVSIGHTSATPEQIREAIVAGATMSTHLGNGAHLMLPRHPNYIWEQLAQDRLWACIIGDGFHLPESFLKTVLRVKCDRTVLVSDAVYLSGMPSGEYETHIGGKVVLTKEGKLHLKENPDLLAGSAQMLIWGIQHLVKSGLTTLSEAWELASTRPSRLLGISSKHGLKTGGTADLVIFNWDNEKVNVLKTYKNGQLVYNENEEV